MAINPLIVETLKRLNPATPPEEGEYIERGMARRWDPASEIEVLLQAGYQVRGLLFGSVGVGKSTELDRWTARLGSELRVLKVEVSSDRQWDERGFMAQLDGELEKQGVRFKMNVFPSRPRDLAWVERPDLILVDGLDRLELTEAKRAFGPSTMLADDAWPAIVFTAPISMLRAAPNSTRDDRFEQVWHLSPFPVIGPDGRLDPELLQHFAEGLARRFPNLELLDDPMGLLRRVAAWSGGIPRDAIRILRGTLMAAVRADRVNYRHLSEGLREVRQDLEQSVAWGDATQQLSAVDKSSDFFGSPELLVSNAVIAYEGAEYRYFRVHPLLRHLVTGDRSYELGGI